MGLGGGKAASCVGDFADAAGLSGAATAGEKTERSTEICSIRGSVSEEKLGLPAVAPGGAAATGLTPGAGTVEAVEFGLALAGGAGLGGGGFVAVRGAVTGAAGGAARGAVVTPWTLAVGRVQGAAPVGAAAFGVAAGFVAATGLAAA